MEMVICNVIEKEEEEERIENTTKGMKRHRKAKFIQKMKG